jgi:hypothetical protein
MWLSLVQLAARPQVNRWSTFAATLLLGVIWGALTNNGVVWAVW